MDLSACGSGSSRRGGAPARKPEPRRFALRHSPASRSGLSSGRWPAAASTAVATVAKHALEHALESRLVQLEKTAGFAGGRKAPFGACLHLGGDRRWPSACLPSRSSCRSRPRSCCGAIAHDRSRRGRGPRRSADRARLPRSVSRWVPPHPIARCRRATISPSAICLPEGPSRSPILRSTRVWLREGAPAVVRFVAQIASRFGIVVSQKVMAQAVVVVGAVGGAALNLAFAEHFQDLARGHFTVRRLEARLRRRRRARRIRAD